MDWDRNRRFDDHRGGESYRPAGGRSYMRRSRSPQRNRSPRLVADTWVPSTGRSYGRARSRSPSDFGRRRSSRSPSHYGRDTGLAPYSKTSQSSRRFSPRREPRPRSPHQVPWRSRSPYGEGRSRDASWSRFTPKRLRDLSPPNQDRLSKRERPPLTATNQYARSSPPPRRFPSRDNGRAPSFSRSRSPFQALRRERAQENTTAQRRRSPSPRGTSSLHISAPGSLPNSRRSSPGPEKPNMAALDSRGRGVATHAIADRRYSRNSEHSPQYRDRTPPRIHRSDREKGINSSSRSPAADQPSVSPGKIADSDQIEPNKHIRAQWKEYSQPSTFSDQIPCEPKAHSSLKSHSPPSRPSPVPKNFPPQVRGSSISMLTAPTRPRGGPSFKENSWSGASPRRAPGSAVPYHPPTGPRSAHVPLGPGMEVHRQSIHRQSSTAGVLYHRAPRYMGYLSGLCSVVPGGKFISLNLDATTERRLSQLDSDKGRLLEQAADNQRIKRLGIRDWDRLDRESSICALKSELAEGHLQQITDGESMNTRTTF